MRKFTKKILKEKLSLIYNSDYYKGIDVYKDKNGLLRFVECPNGCSTRYIECDFVGEIKRSHNIWPQYRFIEYIENYEYLTVEDLIEKLENI